MDVFYRYILVREREPLYNQDCAARLDLEQFYCARAGQSRLNGLLCPRQSKAIFVLKDRIERFSRKIML